MKIKRVYVHFSPTNDNMKRGKGESGLPFCLPGQWVNRPLVHQLRVHQSISCMFIHTKTHQCIIRGGCTLYILHSHQHRVYHFLSLFWIQDWVRICRWFAGIWTSNDAKHHIFMQFQKDAVQYSDAKVKEKKILLHLWHPYFCHQPHLHLWLVL